MIICLIFIIVGGLLLASSSAMLRNGLAFVRQGERAVGTIVELVEERDEDGTFYFPVFDIPDSRYQTITYKHTVGSSRARWQMGDTAMFIFEPGKPDTVKLLSYRGIFGWPLLLLAVAVDLLVVGAGYFLYQGYFGF
ncbi:DUF3592 domain-containing protein [Chitinophaga qingshengii]|uniref:DUF3592 domain-containing protein n=1 Tax=Chitinophaga qingshengii TaxID=1569794 RepID=A0ABR7TUS9_9BACT|nr:DUF3592 domain-containing protein [Chitinophaga qingshengii]MBC9932724.1 hypothetical protein [Chitinophaga qingshengii]